MYEDYEFEQKMKAVLKIRDNEHFTEDLAKEAVDGMINEDGTKGGHYSVEEVEEIVKKHEIQLGEYCIWDFFYVLNMVRSDFEGSIPDNEKSYVQVAKAFLFDEDGPKGKAVKYYMAMKYSND